MFCSVWREQYIAIKGNKKSEQNEEEKIKLIVEIDKGEDESDGFEKTLGPAHPGGLLPSQW